MYRNYKTRLRSDIVYSLPAHLLVWCNTFHPIDKFFRSKLACSEHLKKEDIINDTQTRKKSSKTNKIKLKNQD
jgi:hypothetical protein